MHLKENACICILVVSIPNPYYLFSSALTRFLATGSDALCVCCAHAIDKGIQEFERFAQRKQMRHSILRPNAGEKTELIPLLSFQQPIPVGTHETGFFSQPDLLLH